MMSLEKFKYIHFELVGDHQRMGQRFVNMYIKTAWPQLFYADDEKAEKLIAQWLIDHQYIDELPRLVIRAR